MKILHLHDEPWDSGLAQYALTIAQALAQRGHDVQFWARKDSFAEKRARDMGLPTLGLHQPWLRLGSLRNILREARTEIINAHTGSSHLLAAALASGSTASIVRTRADTRPPSSHFLAKRLAKRTSCFIAANTALSGQLTAAYPDSRVETVYQGISAPPAPPRLPQDETIGILGRLDAVKGHEHFLRAAASLAREFPKARFLIAGSDPNSRQGGLERLARELGLEGRAEFLGRVPDAFEFIAGCRFGVVASIGSEAVSRAALEWMAMGRPLVASRVGCLPDIVEDGASGFLFFPQDAADLSGALKRLLENPTLADQIGQKARRRFEERFSLDRFALETERLYKSLTETRGRP